MSDTQYCKGPFRLTWIHTNTCMVCNKYSEECKMLSLEIHRGWYYCPNCASRVREQALTNMAVEIPLIGSLPINRSSENFKITFERTNKDIWTGCIDPTQYTLICINDIYHMRVYFNATNPEFDNKEMSTYKDIPLNIVYKYNPNIHEKIITCMNLFDNDINISYNDLDDETKHKLNCL